MRLFADMTSVVKFMPRCAVVVLRYPVVPCSLGRDIDFQCSPPSYGRVLLLVLVNSRCVEYCPAAASLGGDCIVWIRLLATSAPSRAPSLLVT